MIDERTFVEFLRHGGRVPAMDNVFSITIVRANSSNFINSSGHIFYRASRDITVDFTHLNLLPNLLQLSLTECKILHFSKISNLMLTHLTISGGGVLDISPLAEMDNLINLSLNQLRIDNISALSNMANITNLNLSRNEIEDISFFGSLVGLTHLELRHNNIEDISALAKLTKLVQLDLSYNAIVDATSIGELASLTKLAIKENPITDIRPIAHLTNLYTLSIDKMDLECLIGQRCHYLPKSKSTSVIHVISMHVINDIVCIASLGGYSLDLLHDINDRPKGSMKFYDQGDYGEYNDVIGPLRKLSSLLF
jgi:Leucine-rich repeat (LRR) protein